MFSTCEAQKALISFTAPRHEKLAVYFVGSTEEINEFESLVEVVQPGKTLTVDVEPKNAFVLRGGDMSFRAKISVFDQVDDYERPLALSFKNLAEGSPGELIELKHSTSGFQWIPPSAEATHSTDFGHKFDLRVGEKKTQMASVRLDRMV